MASTASYNYSAYSTDSAQMANSTDPDGHYNKTFPGNNTDYMYNYTYEYEEYYEYEDPEDVKGFSTAGIVIGFVLVAVIMILNALVIVLLIRNRRDQSRLHFFILHLAIADFLVGAVAVLSDTINQTVGTWLAGDVVCRLYWFAGNVLVCASNNILIGMSIDRFLAVAVPMRSVRSGFHLDRLFVLGAWLLSIVVCVFYLVHSRLKDGECHLDPPAHWWQPYLTIVFVIVYILPALTIFVCYTGICCIIWRKWRKTKNMATERVTSFNGDSVTLNTELRKDSRIQGGVLPKAKIKSIKMTVAICLAFLICWTPFFFYNLLATYEVVDGDVKVYMIINYLYCLNSVANPVIFIIFNLRLFSTKSLRRRSTTSGTYTTTSLLNNAVI